LLSTEGINLFVAGLGWRVDATPHVPSLQGAGGREFARIVQEALSNVIHHAQANRVEIGTRLAADGMSIEVWVADDGRGMPDAPRPGRGLRNMRQRAQRVSALIEWRTPPAPTRGTVLSIVLPLTAPDEPGEA
jgi:signal transduction histidine kinase